MPPWRYSFHPAPVRWPRTTHSTSMRSARRTSCARPRRRSAAAANGAGKLAGSSLTR